MLGTRLARRWTTCGIVMAALLPVGAAVPAAAAAAAAADPACAGATIVGTDGDDVLRGTDGRDVIDGLAGDDRILGLGGDDVLCGGPGNDQVLGGPGADQLLGGDGDDALDGGKDARVREDSHDVVYYGDTLAGGAGDDLLDPGADPRNDGASDTLTFADAEDAAGNGHGVSVDLRAGTATGEGTDTIVATASIETVIGSRYDDVLRGDDGPQRMFGGAGRDVLAGRGGHDRLNGAGLGYDPDDLAGDLLRGGSGSDDLSGSRGDDLLYGGKGADALRGFGGVDQSFGGSGSDAFFDSAEPGDGQSLRGGRGTDTIESLTFVGPDGTSQEHAVGRLDLGEGVLTAEFPTYTLRMETRGLENVTIPQGDSWTVVGDDGPNDVRMFFVDTPVKLYGHGGDDRLEGSHRDDVIYGGRGHDQADGNGGHDRFRSIEEHVRRL